MLAIGLRAKPNPLIAPWPAFRTVARTLRDPEDGSGRPLGSPNPDQRDRSFPAFERHRYSAKPTNHKARVPAPVSGIILAPTIKAPQIGAG